MTTPKLALEPPKRFRLIALQELMTLVLNDERHVHAAAYFEIGIIIREISDEYPDRSPPTNILMQLIAILRSVLVDLQCASCTYETLRELLLGGRAWERRPNGSVDADTFEKMNQLITACGEHSNFIPSLDVDSDEPVDLRMQLIQAFRFYCNESINRPITHTTATAVRALVQCSWLSNAQAEHAMQQDETATFAGNIFPNYMKVGELFAVMFKLNSFWDNDAHKIKFGRLATLLESIIDDTDFKRLDQLDALNRRAELFITPPKKNEPFYDGEI